MVDKLPQQNQQEKKNKRRYRKPDLSKNSISQKLDQLMQTFNIAKHQSFQQLYPKVTSNAGLKESLTQLAPQTRIRQLGQLSVKKLEQQLQKEAGLEGPLNPTDRKLLLEVFLMDDWSTAIKLAAPLIQQYGPTVLNWAKGLFSKRDEVDFSGQTNGGIYNSQKTTNNGTVYTAGIQRSFAKSQYSYDAVDPFYFKSFINPRKYIYRRPTDKASKTAMFLTTSEYYIQTDSLGGAAFYLYPQNVFSGIVTTNAPSAATTFLAASNGVNQQSGVISSLQTTQPGPMNQLTTSVTGYRVNACEVTIIPIIGMNTSQGAFATAYCQNPPNNTTSNPGQSPSIPAAQLPLLPFYQTGNLLQAYDSRRFSADDTDNEFTAPVVTTGMFPDGSPSCDEFIYGAFSGCAINTTIAKLEITVSGEVFPTAGVLPIAVMDTARPGLATTRAISNALLRCPRLQSLSVQECEALCDALPNDPVCFDDFGEMVCNALSKINKMPTKSMSHGSGNKGIDSISILDS